MLPTVSIALASGLAEDLITRYAPVRNKWTVAKLVITTVALAVLVAKMPLVDEAARPAGQGAQTPQLHFADLQLLVHSAAGLAVLLAALALSIYNPVQPRREATTLKASHSQPQRVTDNAYRRQRHRSSGDDRRQ